jgi:glutamate-1-semialdehyde 2,1-aminomutase
MAHLDQAKSARMWEVAKQVIPGGIMSNFKKGLDYQPTYFKYGKGARIYDTDGNEYIDYDLSYGPTILGYQNQHLTEAIVKQTREFYCGPTNELAAEAARKICKHVPSAEKLRFACTGSEATVLAVRVARGYTGRDKIVRFAGQYHGCGAGLFGGIVTDPENPILTEGEREDDIFTQMTNSAGKESGILRNSYMIEWNDLPAMENLLRKRSEDIAAVIMEPVMTNWFGCMPEPGYLEGVRELCTQYGVVLIFDEVLTGFRMGLGGAQGYFGVTPDLTALAKAIGGGYPVSAFCGKEEIMDVITQGEVISGGTYNGHPVAMAAVIATIEELERNNGAVYKEINRLGHMIKDGFEEIAKSYGQDLLIQGYPAAWDFTITPRKKIKNNKEGLGMGLPKAAALSGFLQDEGVLAVVRLFTSTAHTEEDVKKALERADEAIKQFSKAERKAGEESKMTLL